MPTEDKHAMRRYIHNDRPKAISTLAVGYVGATGAGCAFDAGRHKMWAHFADILNKLKEA